MSVSSKSIIEWFCFNYINVIMKWSYIIYSQVTDGGLIALSMNGVLKRLKARALPKVTDSCTYVIYIFEC